MSHFAKIEDGIVTQVIVAEQDVIDSGLFGNPADWVQTSYNTKLNRHHDHATGEPDAGAPMRGNFASIGHIYDSENDVFYPQKPFPSWVINTSKWIWIAPVPYPTDVGTEEAPKYYKWDEETISWVETTDPVVAQPNDPL